MAQITWRELLEAVETHPDYKAHWELGAPARHALYIQFHPKPPGVTFQQEVVELADGSDLVLDRGPDGRVYGLELA